MDHIVLDVEIKWFEGGLIHKVINYCADDVALERDLCDFVDRYGFVLNGETILRIPQWFGLSKPK